MLQVLLNHLLFGDDIQTAIERRRFSTSGFPSSFSPHIIASTTLEVEENMATTSVEQLEALGYTIRLMERWGIPTEVGAVIKTNTGYTLGTDPRAETIALGK